ncbi:AAA family ATPase [Microbacterium sp. kSW2-24]|uniref:ATP-dependent nuclease n=1 Tax=Microbacterium galbinum TaxID=2851646 RepID=UPI001FFDDA60|nr:AAA family ATPase [Microbacterium galbinum]MCK2024361.1 AAA family ATPase [Microbacterium galbinum]
MKFIRVRSDTILDRPNTVYLRSQDWDDWFKFATTFFVSYVDANGTRHRIGTTKIGKFGLAPAGRGEGEEGVSRRPGPPQSFKRLGTEFFSLAQDSSFYESLTALGGSTRDEVLDGLRDLAYVPGLLEKAQDEPVTKVSLLRDVPLLTVKEQFSRLAKGGAKLTEFNLRYKLTYAPGTPSVTFAVDPDSALPTNIHVIVGRNGVGKSTFLNSLATHFVQSDASRSESGGQISNLVSVSFSAFDAFEPLSVAQDRTKSLTYHYVGLKLVGASKDEADRIKGPRAIASEFTKSSRSCLRGARKDRLAGALRLLESDPVFAASGIADVVEGHESTDSEDETLNRLGRLFKRLSSGHKIVLLTTTKLVETVSEKSLVLLDEPEAHLHPPLLSAFVRALSDLLLNRNGVAVVATHSPVVLQEVPRDCVWKMNRKGDVTTLRRPAIETFGENVGTLTSELFGLEVTATGYHGILLETARNFAAEGYEAALESLGGQVGAEGRSVLRSMIEVMGRQHVGR